MTPLLKLVVCMAVFTWITIMLASLIRSRGWTMNGLMVSLGNRENQPAPVALAGRADRAAANTKENFVLFSALALTAAVAGVHAPHLDLGAEMFVGARLVYLPVYLIGIPYLRTGVWAVSIAGMALMVSTLI